MDNSTAVQALGKMGSIKSPPVDYIVKDIWQWAISRKNWLSAAHIPGVTNIEADLESREATPHLEWMLDNKVFRNIIQLLKFQPSIDIFASRLNNQLKDYISFRPDPGAIHVDAFTVRWDHLKFYAFPPFNLIGKCIQKICLDQAEGIMVVPAWKSQVWYSEFTKICVTPPIVFPARKTLLILPCHPDQHHPIWSRLTLLVAVVSGRP
jgi:hypothetical protein